MANSLVALLGGTGHPFRHNEPARIAAHLANGEGFSSPYAGSPIAPTAQQPPLYPFLEAVAFKIFGVYSLAALRAIVWMNVLAGAAITLLIYLAGRRYASTVVGLMAGWTWALLPAIAATDVYISNYALTTLVVLIWLLVIPRMPASSKAWILLGLGLGVAVLLNSALLILFPASYGWLVKKRRHALMALVTTVAVMTPWLIRNYFALGHFYPMLRDNVGLELYIGNHAAMQENGVACAWNLCAGTYDYANAYQGVAEMGEVPFIQKRTREAVAYIRAEPGRFLQRSAKRLAGFWLLPYPWFYLVITVLAWIGAVQIAGPLGTFLVVMFGLYPVVFYATQIAWATSYRHPIEPLMLLSAGVVLTRACDQLIFPDKKIVSHLITKLA
jgi:4-amino-4-deoxy-L-arabinose transferase-like glycosyltransferase